VELAPGTILLGKYRIDGLIGTGGMGHVVRASHLYLHQPVAIKLLLPELAESTSTVQRFLREAQATVKLRSEHIARVMDVGTTDDSIPFMVMEFLEGNDLNQILRHHGPQQPAIVVDLMMQACEGIAEAHALGIIHRDVKPSNFFITQRPDGSMLLKILDFGISKTPIGYDELTGTQTVIGTPSYMAPEQMKSGRAADPRSDIWSMGVVMYQLISGRPPFSGESYAELVLKVGLEAPQPFPVPVPTGFDTIVMRCLEKDPAQRHQTVADLARMLAPFATDPASAAQSAARAARILQQRSALQGMQGSPLAMGGGLATPIPISPAQLTPRSWPPSQATSVSRGAGQMTLRTRSQRGVLIASVAGLCLIAAAGGYAVSRLSRDDGVHVQAPLPTKEAPTAAAEPATPPPAAAEPAAAAPPPATAPPPAAAAAASPPAAAAPPPAAAAAVAAPAPPSPPAPTISESAAKPANTTAAKPATRSDDDGSHPAGRLIDAKHTGELRSAHEATIDGKPATRSADAKPATRSADAKPATRSVDAKPATKSTDKSPKTQKPKPKPDDLFNNRR
jgi:serine/threonine-protein kinase